MILYHRPAPFIVTDLNHRFYEKNDIVIIFFDIDLNLRQPRKS